jgi:hypothetical protein
MPPKRFRYAVTFESLTLPPLTIRGEVIAGETQTIARLAVKDAMSQAKGKHWSSLSILLERTDADAGVEEAPERVDREEAA